MKIKMSEHFQGTGVSAVLVRTGTTVNALAPDEVYEVDLALGSWLVDNHKGVEADEMVTHTRATYGDSTVHYGAQAEPELSHDDVLYEAQTGGENATEVTPDEDSKPDKPKRRSRK